jgi:hypothetical protein
MPRLFVLGEFATGGEMVAAARRLRLAGFDSLDTHSPYPVHGYEEALALPRSPVALYTLIGGLTGVALAYLMMWWCNAVDYPLNVGGRPSHSPPTFVPICFELGVLFGALSAFIGLWALCRLPRPHHPVFELEAFRSATVDRYWVSVATDERDRAIGLLEQAGAERVSVVEEAAG